jgi:inorganic pyrophosphatase
MLRNPTEMKILQKLPPFDRKSGKLNVVIDTPKGCRNKYAFDFKRNVYVLKAVLPKGTMFPFDFGSIAGTKGEDGDPLDVLVLMDEPAYPGIMVEARLIGVIEANQVEHGKTERNDRLIAVAEGSNKNINSIDDLDETLVKEIEEFFVNYNRQRGKKFTPLGRFGPKRAKRLIIKQWKRPT